MRGTMALLLALLSLSVPVAPSDAAELPASEAPPAAGEHPLLPVLQMAEQGMERFKQEVQDYTFTIIMRERRKGKMKPYQFLNAKLRNKNPEKGVPFSVYLKFQKPATVAGREVLYVEGRDLGKMLVRRGGKRMAFITTYLDPESPLAMDEYSYPITTIGFVRIVEEMSKVIREDLNHGECTVQFFKNAKIGDLECTRVVIEHPYPREHFRFHKATVFIDEKRNLPLAYSSYQWPSEPGGEPILVEEYIHSNIQLNVGLTDEDFSRDNPGYGFLKEEEEDSP